MDDTCVLPGHLGDSGLHRPVRPLLHDHDQRGHHGPVRDIGNSWLDEVAGPERRVKCQVEQSKVLDLASQLQAGSNGPDIPALKWRIRVDKMGLFHGPRVCHVRGIAMVDFCDRSGSRFSRPENPGVMRPEVSN